MNHDDTGAYDRFAAEHSDTPNILRCEAGPNNWDEVGPSDFGPEQDFDLEDAGSLTIIYPVSNAALQWLYRHLPEDCPRWGAKGFAIETNYVRDIIRAMKRDRLMSYQDYLEAEEELHKTQWQQHQEDYA